MRVSIGGGEPEMIADRQSLVRGVSVDDARVTWTTFSASGTVGAARLPSLERCILRGERTPFAIASNGEDIVWTSNGAGEIARGSFHAESR